MPGGRSTKGNLPFAPCFIGPKMVEGIFYELNIFTPWVSSGGRVGIPNTTSSLLSYRGTKKGTRGEGKSSLPASSPFGDKQRRVRDIGGYFPSSGSWRISLAAIASISSSGPSIRIGVTTVHIPGISFGLSSRRHEAGGRRHFEFGPCGVIRKRREFPGPISSSGHSSSRARGISLQMTPRGFASYFPSIGVFGRKGKGMLRYCGPSFPMPLMRGMDTDGGMFPGPSSRLPVERRSREI